MTSEERAELRELCSPLMPEGWKVSDRRHLFSSAWGVMEMRAVTDETDGVIAWLPYDMGNEAELIAAARTALPRLLDALEREERLRAESQRGIEKLRRRRGVWKRRAKYGRLCQRQSDAMHGVGMSYLEGMVRGLTVALHDAINRPMGVVPEFAEPFYSPDIAGERRAALDAPTTPPDQEPSVARETNNEGAS